MDISNIACFIIVIHVRLETIWLKYVINSRKKENDVNNIYYTLNKFFTLLHCYWGFGQPDKEKYKSLHDHLNYSFPGIAIFRYMWGIYCNIK